MNSSTGSSTNSLLQYAENLDKSASKITQHAGQQVQEYELIDQIAEKGIEDHKEKRDLRSRLKNAEERIKSLEDILSKKSQIQKQTKPVSSQTTDITFDTTLTAKTLHKDASSVTNSSTNSLIASSTEESDLVLIQSSPISTRTSTTSSLLKSKSTSKPSTVFTTDSTTKDNSLNGKNKHEQEKSVVINRKSSSKKSQYKSNSTNLKTSTTDLLTYDISETTSPTITLSTSTKNAIPTKSNTTNDISVGTSTIVQSTTKPSVEESASSMSTHDSYSKYSLSTSSILNSTKHSLTKGEIRTKHTKSRSKSTHHRYDDEIERGAHEKVKLYLQNYRDRKRNNQRDFFEGWHDYRVRKAIDEYNKPLTTSEIINDLEKYAEVKFNEMEKICCSMQKKFCCCNKAKKIQEENIKLKMNMKKIKRAVREYKDAREIQDIDGKFRTLNEKELLRHIAIEFHDFLGSNEDISRETAYKLVTRAAKSIQH